MKRGLIRKFLVVLMSSLLLALALPSIANADWIEYKIGPVDSDAQQIQPVQYDLSRLDYAISDTNPDEFWFFLLFSQPVKEDMFNNSVKSWAAVMIDVDLDNKTDFSIETTYQNYNGNYYMKANFADRRGDNPVLVSSCNAQTWTNTPKSVNWIGFSIKKTCISFNKSFKLLGFVDPNAETSGDFDYTPNTHWEVTPGTGSSSTPSSSSTSTNSSSSNLASSQLVEYSTSQIMSISTPAAAPKDLVTLTPKIAPSVVTVLCADSSGTGWAIDVKLTSTMITNDIRSFVITNHHVIEPCISSKQVTLVLNDQKRVSGTIWAWSEADDTAGITTTTAIPSLNWRGALPQQGWWLGVYGSPLGFPGVLTTGIVSSVSSIKKTLTTTAPLNPGNSGGPVFDREGRVVGLATAKYVNSEGFGIVHGTPLLCNKIINCSDPNTVWATDQSLVKNSTEDDTAALAAKAKAEAEAKAIIEAEAKAKAEAELKLAQEVKLREEFNRNCSNFNGDRDLIIFNAQNAKILYPTSSSLLQSVLDNAPEPLDCYYINLSTFETELLNKRKILTSYEAIMASAIDTAKENAKKKVTITCTKGKLTKKVTAINPKCPKGYKKK
jgi:hypothetical protein